MKPSPTTAPAGILQAAKATRERSVWLRRNRLELIACCVIGTGLLMLLQPFALVLYTWSFVVLLAGTVLFMAVSKFPE